MRNGRCIILAIPPSMFAAVVEGLAKSGSAKNARVVVEKPFGRDLASARELDAILHEFFPEDSDLQDRSFSGQGAGPEHSLYALRQSDFLSRYGIAPTSARCKSPWRRISGCKGADDFTKKPAPSAT